MTYFIDFVTLSINKIEKWKKGCIILFLKKGDLEITKNYRGITLLRSIILCFSIVSNLKSRKR